MSNSAEPSIHRQRELDFIRHVEGLLKDDRLRVDTTRGRRPVTALILSATRADRSVELKRMMAEMNRPDRELQSQMPTGEMLDVTLSQRKLFIFNSKVGRLKAVCVSPTRSLVAGEEAQPLKPSEVQKILGEFPPPAGAVPSTLVLMSTSGFTIEAHELAERRADRTVVMVEPNKAGGWAVYGPVETKSLVDLFDPEAEDTKRSRVREEIEAAQSELTGSGIASDRIATKTQLPLQLVESELKAHAKANAGLVAKRLDGRVVLFRAGSVPASKGADMPLIDRVKTLFARKGENEKKIAFLSERRTALSQQRDRSYEEMSTLEQREAGLRQQFKDAGGDITKRRVTSQLLQLRKDIERRQQLLTVLNQQINVVSTHLHNLELVQQGQVAKLPDGEEIAADAAKAEEMLAQLEADSELVSSVGGIASTGLSAEEQALYDELEQENTAATAKTEAPAAVAQSSTSSSPVAQKISTPAAPQSAPVRKAEPEADDMKLPMIRGKIDRRMLLNYRVDPVAAAALLPPPFQPKLFKGFAIVGICLIRLKEMRPGCLPAALGFSSENAAHRIAVQWTENGAVREGVYIPRRDTNSVLTRVGGRIFTGEHERAHFDVTETSDRLSLSLRSDDGCTSVSVRARVTSEFATGSIFGSLKNASAFFEAGSVGYSATSNATVHDGVQLQCEKWEMQPLEVEEVRSSFFEDAARFAPGTVVFDCGLLMRNIEHEWHSLEPMCCERAVA